MKLNATVIFLLLFAVGMVQAQVCNNYHREKKFCPPSKDGFVYNGQSRSAYFYRGQTSELNVIFHNKQDYRVSFCLEETLGDRIEFKIKDGKTGELLYNNADEDYTTTFEFRCESTRRLAFDITIPEEGDGGGGGKLKKLKATTAGCIGVLIEHMTTQRSGF
jgi:hypothetical protein